jgi:hypothetical protein
VPVCRPHNFGYFFRGLDRPDFFLDMILRCFYDV